MDEKTLTALKGSIAKWQAIVDGTGVDNADRNCPLCRVFSRRDCDGCPVRSQTGQPFCDDTPYKAWFEHQHNIHGTPVHPAKIECPDCIPLAQAELDFLRGLLPEGVEP